MTRRSTTTTTLEATAEQLRALVLSLPEGTILGNEEALIAQLGCARGTMRQVARLLEREGLIRVRRGVGGGYFAARPTEKTIEDAVSAYLKTIDVAPQDITRMASLLWEEVIRMAAAAPAEARDAVADALDARIAAVPDHADFRALYAQEEAIRETMTRLAGSRYIELIFRINIAFASRYLSGQSDPITDAEQRRFVIAWRDSKRMECAAIRRGDPEIAATTARLSRALWQERVKQRMVQAS